MFTKMIFENDDLRIGYDESFDVLRRVLVAARDRGTQTNYERWVIEHLSVNDIRMLRDRLDELLEEIDS